jgi:hypothetical protein
MPACSSSMKPTYCPVRPSSAPTGPGARLLGLDRERYDHFPDRSRIEKIILRFAFGSVCGLAGIASPSDTTDNSD